MKASRTCRLLLHLYPPAWRRRYGEELLALMAESSGGRRRISFRDRVNVAIAAGAERLRAAGLSGDGVPPSDRVRAGWLLVLWAWVLFVLAGLTVQKVSEHWQDVTPSASRTVPGAAFDGLLVAAAAGSLLVVAGVAALLPSLVAFLRRGGWPRIRRRIVTSALLTALATAGTVVLAAWAHRLTGRQRNGHDAAYAAAFVIWAALIAATLCAWATAATATMRRLDIAPATLRLEAFLAAAVSGAMGAMTLATAIWWVSLADSAPWFLAGQPIGSAASPLSPAMLVATAAMLAATAMASIGTVLAIRALRTLPGELTGGTTIRRR